MNSTCIPSPHFHCDRKQSCQIKGSFQFMFCFLEQFRKFQGSFPVFLPYDDLGLGCFHIFLTLQGEYIVWSSDQLCSLLQLPSIPSVSAKCSDYYGKLILCCYPLHPLPHHLNLQGFCILIFILPPCLTWAGESFWILSISHRIQGRVEDWMWISRYFSV